MLIILFGLSGSGKNFVAETLTENFDYIWWDADQALTPEMQNCIAQQTPFTQPMRNHFINIVIEKISELTSKHSNVIITQALYKEQNRQQLTTAFPEAIFIHIQALDTKIAQRLTHRGEQVKAYAQVIQKFFEPPTKDTFVITNNTNKKDILQQFAAIIQNNSSQTH